MKKGLMEVRAVSLNFPGFYDSVFSSEFDTSSFPAIVDKFFEDNWLWDYVDKDKYQKQIGYLWLNTMLPGGVWAKDIKIISPKEYNFITDKIEYTCELDKPFDKIVEEVSNHPYFERFLKEAFTAYDGFIPYYSNDKKEFLETMFERDLPYEIEAGVILYVYSLIKYDPNGEFEEAHRSMLENAEYEASYHEEEEFNTQKFVENISKICNVKGTLQSWYDLKNATYNEKTNTLTFN